MSANHARLSPYSMSTFDQELKALWTEAQSLKPSQRLYFFSEAFIGRPYLVGACGEGEFGEFDQSPLYRSDVFDCVTYINTVLALCLAKQWSEFEPCIVRLNYYKSNPSYLSRFHFMSVDWNVQNALNHIVEDVTYTIKDDKLDAVMAEAKTLIEKPRWLRFRSLEDIKLLNGADIDQAQARLDRLHQQVGFYQDMPTVTPYIPLSKLFYQQKPNMTLFQQISGGCLLEIIRPNWDLRDQIGTCLNVSHVGFVIKTPDGLQYRQASTVTNTVCDTPLVDYLQHCLNSPTIGGINLQMPCFALAD